MMTAANGDLTKMRRNFIDKTGQSFGLLTFVGWYRRRYRGAIRIMWVCKCTCGGRVVVWQFGKQKSCGCIPSGPKKGARYRPRRHRAIEHAKGCAGGPR